MMIMRRMVRRIVSLNVAALTLLSVSEVANSALCQDRAFTVDDLFALQSLAAVAPSPDGRMVAVVVQRAWNDPVTFRPYEMAGFDQSDVWLLDTESGEIENVTQGGVDGSGYWNPVWSPNGRTLALLSTRGGDNVRLYALDIPSRRITRLTEQGIDLGSGHFGPAPWQNPMLNSLLNPVLWLDANRLLATVLPPGEQPQQLRLRRQTTDLATRVWRAAHDGAAPTASVLDTGDSIPSAVASELVLVDLSNGSQRVLTRADVRDVLVAPGGHHAMIIEVESPPGRTSPSHRLGVITFEDEPVITWIDDIAEPVLLFGESAHQFSPDGAMLAVLGQSPESASIVTQVLDLRSHAVHSVATNVAPEKVAWAGRQLLVHGRRRADDERRDWWVAWDGRDMPVPGAPARNLTAAMPASPTSVIQPIGDGGILAVAQGELWSMRLSGGQPVLLTGGIEGRVTGMVPQPGSASVARKFVVVTRDGSQRFHYHLDMRGRTPVLGPIAAPPGGSIVVYDPSRERVLAWAPNNASGSSVWIGPVSKGATRRVVALNEHLADVAPHPRLLVEYQGEDGQPLQAVVMLPPRDAHGGPPPAVFWVYPGYEVRDTVQYWMTLNHAHADNLNVLAGAGYAVVIPSMPLGPPPRADLIEQTTVGVLPLLDRLAELALVDTARVAVIGQSFGGYGVLALIGRTSRFRTAVAIDGFANLTSLFGTFDARARYTGTVHLDPVQARFLAGPVLGLGSTPWDDPERYWQNSPLAFVSDVETPVLLIQGDLDYVPMQQSEEYFTALQWLGKPARFVRYWGESHGVNAAANIRNRWSQVLEWLRQTNPSAVGTEDSLH